MTHGPPVTIDVVCPACDGAGCAIVVRLPAPCEHVACALCHGRGEVEARLAEVAAEAMADTERPTPDDDEDTSP
jgi:DnaJ-class molecular chaperone